jgi:hypothetical protein
MSEFAEIARNNLDAMIRRGRARAGTVVERIQTEVPDDRIAHARAFGFAVLDDGALELAIAGPAEGSEPGRYAVHTNAQAQLAAAAGVPGRYLRDLLIPDQDHIIEVDGGPQTVIDTDNSWRRDLAERTLAEHFRHSNKRHLVRSVRDEIRGVMSDRFRRLDARPLFEAFAEACAEIGAIPVDGTSTDTRVSVQAIIPRIHEPVDGDPIVLGLDWSTSDFGQAPYGIRGFAARLVCLNGMIGHSEITQRHLGGRLADNVDWSQQTLEADTATMRLATGDVVRAALGPARVDAYLASLRQAAERETTFARAITTVGKDLTKAEREAAATALDSPDVVNLPKGKSQWRAANALSWIANGEDVEPQRRLELQELSGKLLPRAA